MMRDNGSARAFALLGGARCFEYLCGLPIPRQQRCQFVKFGTSRDNSFQHVGQPGQRIDLVQLCGLKQCGDNRPMPPTAVGAGKQCILASESHRPHGTFDSIGVQLQAAVIKIEDQSVPMVQGVAHCLGQCGAAGDTLQLFGQPDAHRLDQRPATLLTYRSAVLGMQATELGLDGVEFGNAPQGFRSQRRLGGDMDVVELAPDMRPAEGEPRGFVRLAGDQAAKPRIAIDLEQATEPAQMGLRVLSLLRRPRETDLGAVVRILLATDPKDRLAAALASLGGAFLPDCT